MQTKLGPSLVIFNPIAGNGRASKYWPLVKNALKEAGIDFKIAATNAPFEAKNLAQEAPGNYSMIISIGGDGTINEIVNGLMRATNEKVTLPLAVVPLGNGDDFAKMIPPETSIGSKSFDWKTAVRKIVRGQTQLFDLGRITGVRPKPGLKNEKHYFVNSFDVGFGPIAAQNLRTIPSFLNGLPAYLAAIVKTMINFPALNLQIKLDDHHPFEQTTTITAVMNGRCMANGFWVCPTAKNDDGVFDLMVSQQVGRFTIMRMIPKLMKGTHVNESIVSMYQAEKVVIKSRQPLAVETDGEIPYQAVNRLELEVLPKRLRVIV